MYRLLVADDEMIERAVLVQLLEEELGDSAGFFRQKMAGKRWRSMKRRRSRSQYWILKCRELPVLKQRRG